MERHHRRRHGSSLSNHHHHHDHIHEAPPTCSNPGVAGSNLAVPVVDVSGRKRAASTSGAPQPIIINADSGSRRSSRERWRPRSHSRSRYDFDDDDDDDFWRGRRSRARHSRSPSVRPWSSHRDDFEVQKMAEQLRVLQKEKDDAALEERWKNNRKIEKAKKAEDERKRDQMIKEAIEADKRKLAEKKRKEEEEEEAREKLVNERVIKTLEEANLGHLVAEDKSGVVIDRVTSNTIALDRARPTVIRIERKHLLEETLKHYQVDYQVDGTHYYLTKPYSQSFIEELFEDTKNLRSQGLITSSSSRDYFSKDVTVKVNDAKKDRLYLVRKKR